MIKWKKSVRSLCLGMALTMTISYTALASTEAATGPGAATQTNTATADTAAITSAINLAAQNTTQPTVAAQGAVLYDATHNVFLFSKNADTAYYPASITKLMTALLVAENCNLDDKVTFSSSAVTNLESGAVTLQVKAGDVFSVKDCLYGMLLKSANEIANGLAEHVSGSVSAFADKMNEKAALLGCTNTHFANPNGLNNANHYTTAHDMALIANAAFNNATVRQVASTLNYDFPTTASVPTVRKLTMGHKMLNPANSQYYEGIVGGKTGYTSLAGNTLATVVEKNGVRMIAVILKSSQTQYDDTKKLLDYGYEVISKVNVGTTGTNSTNNTWQQVGNDWKYLKSNGSYAANESLVIDNNTYYFKADALMARDWQLVNGSWRYFAESGIMAKNSWIQTNGYWYYVGADGALYVNTTTPDGNKVDANGVWIQ